MASPEELPPPAGEETVGSTAGGPDAMERFRPWLVPLVLVGVLVITAALIGGGGMTGDQRPDRPGAVPPGGVTIVTFGPPPSAAGMPQPAAPPAVSATTSTGAPAASAAATTAPAATGAAPRPSAGDTTGKPDSGRMNLALLRPVTASSVENDDARLAAAKAVDGDAATRWSSAWQIDPQWIRVDLGEVRPVTSVEILWERASTRSYHVEVSVDGAVWNRVHQSESVSESLATIAVADARGRYLRITGTARGNGSQQSSYGYSIREWRIY